MMSPTGTAKGGQRMKVDVSNLKARSEEYLPDMIALQKKLTAIPAMGPENGGDGEEEKAKALAQYMEKEELGDIEWLNAPDKRVSCGFRPNLLLRIPGKSTDRSLIIISHMDVVPPGNLSLWDHDPFDMVIMEDRIVGRGVEDNQQGIVCSLHAARILKQLDITPALTVKLLFVADEETGSKKGLQFLLEEHPGLFKKDDLILVPDYGNEDGTMIEVAEKSILWVKVSIKGKQCHASVPQKGKNTLRATAHFIVESENLFKTFPESDPMFRPPASTFEPTKKEPNVENINTIPGEDTVYFDCRILPCYDLETVVDAFQKIAQKIENDFGVVVNISTEMYDQAAAPTPADSPVVVNIARAVKLLRDQEAQACGIGGVTVAAHLRKRHLNVAVWQTITKTAHQPNEYCLLKNMVMDTQVMAYLMMTSKPGVST